MPKIQIDVIGKYARSPDAEIVCGNSDYIFEFNFSDEWKAHDLKTARFIFADKTVDTVFTGNEVPVPIVKNASMLEVGVFAGDLCTTTPALVGCKKSILCKDGAPEEPEAAVYNQIIQMIESGMLKGDDYVLTEADKREIASMALELMPNGDEVRY